MIKKPIVRGRGNKLAAVKAKAAFLNPCFNFIESCKAYFPNDLVPLSPGVAESYTVGQNGDRQNRKIFIYNIITAPHKRQSSGSLKVMQSRPWRSAQNKALVNTRIPDYVGNRFFQALVAEYCGGSVPGGKKIFRREYRLEVI